MRALRYIHAADLHLDAPFLGVSRSLEAPRLAGQLRKASFTALERLCDLCEREKPDFLVVAGDIYNQETYSIKAQLALRDACERLRLLSIPVFLAHGNHDPLSSRLTAVLWPENVIFFGPEVTARSVEIEGEIVALVHGISHEKAGESRNLSRLFARDTKLDKCFQLGVLHATVEGQSALRYAPCTLADLKESGLDAWALGHVHKHAVLSQRPFIAYSGSVQGLHVNEPGSHGCLVITASHDGVEWVCGHVFHPLAPVQWEEVECDLEHVESLDEAEARLAEALNTAAAEAGIGCEALVARIVLRGRTGLDALLRQKTVLEDLSGRLQYLARGRPCLWIKDMCCRTQAPRERDLSRDDILGEVLRLAAALRADPESFGRLTDRALGQLYMHKRAARFLSVLPESELLSLLQEAETLCEESLDPNENSTC
ncbi:MAG: DNA repair exonuclease [Desulfovibrio sp.]|jgi:DNA repair exonuclease SbcCD nuclease subunit|nr:DNA repair exonuclease [Desulfovibrio sp.]